MYESSSNKIDVLDNIENNSKTINIKEDNLKYHVNEVKNNISEPEVVIYRVQDDYQNTVCKIIEKSYKINKKCLLLCNSPEEVELFDSKLWTYSKLSFIPHGSKYSINTSDAIHCNTWISDDIVLVNTPSYLISLGFVCNDNIHYNFEKIIFISYNEHDNLDLIRNKYRNCTVWIKSGNKWIKSTQ